MESGSPVTIHQILNRGAVTYKVKWEEFGAEHDKSFPTEDEAAMEMGAIEERIRIAAMVGQGLTVNPFGMHIPFINSKDVHFAALKLQPRGLKFRESIEDYVAAVNIAEEMGMSVEGAVGGLAELNRSLKPYDVSPQQAIFEWLEIKSQIGDRPLYEVLRAYLKMSVPSGALKPDETPGKVQGATQDAD